MVSGAVALMLSQTPALQPDDVKAALRKSAVHLFHAPAAQQGEGEIDLGVAMAKATTRQQRRARRSPMAADRSTPAAAATARFLENDNGAGTITTLSGDRDIFGATVDPVLLASYERGRQYVPRLEELLERQAVGRRERLLRRLAARIHVAQPWGMDGLELVRSGVEHHQLERRQVGRRQVGRRQVGRWQVGRWQVGRWQVGRWQVGVQPVGKCGNWSVASGPPASGAACRRYVGPVNYATATIRTIISTHGRESCGDRRATTGTQSAGASRLRSFSPLWLLAAAMAATAFGVYHVGVPNLVLSPTGVHLPWFVLAAGFALADRNVVHLHFRGEAHAFSLSEIVVVVGLFFAAPSDLLLAQLLGCGLVMAGFDRMPPLKLLYNLSQLALGTVLAIVVFRAVSDAGGPLDHLGWIAAIIACGVAMVVTLVAIAVAVAVMQRRFDMSDIARSFAFGFLSTCANTMMGLIVVIVCWRSLPAAALLVGPIVVMLVAYRAYLSERAKSEGLQFLYSASEVLNQAADADVGLVALLEFARKAFHAELAEIVVLGNDDDPIGNRTARGPGRRVGPHGPHAARGLGTDGHARERQGQGGRAERDRGGAARARRLRDLLRDARAPAR